MRTCRGLKGNGQRGFKDEDIPKDHEKRQLYQIGKELLKNGYHEIGMDHFALESDSLYTAFMTCIVILWGIAPLKQN
jgi:oxygen-independent coproporphyrinogen-3 oxidase